MLAVPGKERDAASILLARLLTRKDTRKEFLTLFMNTVQSKWNDADVFYKMGCLRTVSIMCNLLEPAAIFEYLDAFTKNFLFEETNSPATYDKLVSKTLGRIGVIYASNNIADESILEQILDKLFQTLSGSDTIVRLAASKAIANIAQCLPTEMQKDIVNMVFGIILDDCPNDPGEPESLHYIDRYNSASVNQWHGTLVLIAELLQRKLIRPNDIHDLVIIIRTTLTFEQRKLTYAVGSNVRDSSCYVCWALFRSYSDIPAAVFDELLTELAATSCFDREINIRRAASAAVQEGIGRHPDEAKGKGIEMIQALDFFKLGNRELAYLTVAPKLYSMGFTDLSRHLRIFSVMSWDEQVARLAGRALGIISKQNPQARKEILHFLTRFATDRYPSFLDNLLYALGEVYLSSGANDFAEKITELKALNKFSTEDRTLAEGYLHFLRAVFSNITNPVAVFGQLEEIMLKNWDTVSPDLQCIARSLNSEQKQVLPLKNWLEEVATGSQNFIKFLCEVDISIPELPHLLELLIVNSDREMAIRCTAIRSLSVLLQRCPSLVNEDHLHLLLSCLDNYKVNHQGDVGSWMRKEAILACGQLTNNGSTISPQDWQKFQTGLVTKLVRLSVELLDNLREEAVKALIKLPGIVPEFFRTKNLLKIMETNYDKYFSALITILDLEKSDPSLADLSQEFLRGLVYTTGARYASPIIIKAAFTALSVYLSSEDEQWTILHLKRIIMLASTKREELRVAEGAIGVVATLLEAGVQIPSGLT